jgi:hypothetical protein
MGPTMLPCLPQVLRAGKVAQFGTHAELLQDPTGLYSLMWSNQQSSGIAELAA